MEGAAPGVPVVVAQPSKTPLVKKRLPPEGSNILVEFFNAVSENPTSDQREQLATQIRAVPSCEWYSSERVRTWFQNRRSNKSRSGTIKLEKVAFLYPSINAEAEQNLGILYKKIPRPTTREKEIWAEKLRVTLEDLNIWVELHQERDNQRKGERDRKRELKKEKKPSIQEPAATAGPTGINATNDSAAPRPAPGPQLPTPPATASPEPSSRQDSIKKSLAMIIGGSMQMPFTNMTRPPSFHLQKQCLSWFLKPRNLSQKTRN